MEIQFEHTPEKRKAKEHICKRTQMALIHVVIEVIHFGE